MWHYEKRGVYSVKSGYKLGMRQRQQSQSSSSSGCKKWWEGLWGLKIPSKIKVFMWRACEAIIPTRVNLQRRGVSVDVLCPACFQHPETTDHALVTCRRSKRFWKNLLPSFDWSIGFNDSFMDRCVVMQSLLSGFEFSLWCVGCWALWNDRNACSNGKRVPDAAVKADWVGAFLADFLSVTELQGAGFVSSNRRQEQVERWERPSCGWARINTDASCSVATNMTGIDVVVRMSSGRLHAAQMEVYPALLSPVIAEARALLIGLQLASSLGLMRVEMESDCLNLISMLTGSLVSLQEDRTWVEDILHLASSFESVVFRHVHREGNHPAHCLASKACYAGSMIWCSNFPTWMIRVVS